MATHKDPAGEAIDAALARVNEKLEQQSQQQDDEAYERFVRDYAQGRRAGFHDAIQEIIKIVDGLPRGDSKREIFTDLAALLLDETKRRKELSDREIFAR